MSASADNTTPLPLPAVEYTMADAQEPERRMIRFATPCEALRAKFCGESIATIGAIDELAEAWEVGREVPEVAAPSKADNVIAWAAQRCPSGFTESTFSCMAIPCIAAHTDASCYWTANRLTSMSMAVDAAVAGNACNKFEYGASRDIHGDLESAEPVQPITLDRCCSMNNNTELFLYGWIPHSGEPDLDSKVLAKYNSKTYDYIGRALANMVEELGLCKTIPNPPGKVADVATWYDRPSFQGTYVRTFTDHGAGRAGEMNICGSEHKLMKTTQLLRCACGFAESWGKNCRCTLTQVAYPEQVSAPQDTMTSQIDIIVCDWQDARLVAGDIECTASIDGHSHIDRISGGHPSITSDWKAEGPLQYLVKGYCHMWRSVISALYGTIKLSSVIPKKAGYDIRIDGHPIARLIPVMPMRRTSTWAGPILPPFMSKGSLSFGGPLTQAAMVECKLGGLSEFPVISIGATLFNRVLYAGGAASYCCALMDHMFFYDYGLRDVGGSIGKWYKLIEGISVAYSGAVSSCKCEYYLYERGRCSLVTFHGINFKRLLEDSLRGQHLRSNGLAMVWDDLPLMLEMCYFDGAMPVTLVDGGVSRANRWDGALGRLINDFVDYGFDVSCSEVANMVTTLCGGIITYETLAASYQHLCHALNGMYAWRANQSGALGVLTTALWQLGDFRHRTMAFAICAAADGFITTPCTATGNAETCIVQHACDLGSGVPLRTVMRTVQAVGLLNVAVVVSESERWAEVRAHAKGPWAVDVCTIVDTYKALIAHARAGGIPVESAGPVVEAGTDVVSAALTRCCRDMDQLLVDMLWRAVIELYCYDGIGLLACYGSLAVVGERNVGDDREGFCYSTRPFV
ncbi:hypothetical protein BGZ92_005127 [Podila epicladia]|nr:hypothetical protein BGZ92_005127 [Podila epicladia]